MPSRIATENAAREIVEKSHVIWEMRKVRAEILPQKFRKTSTTLLTSGTLIGVARLGIVTAHRENHLNTDIDRKTMTRPLFRRRCRDSAIGKIETAPILFLRAKAPI